ncbi:flotillin family protein [Cyanobacterium aponinum UTEX 3222]|uniref:Band 7 protein n=2 Tax=Cyanobacterium aponinum TaxID=379064 RepID=K9Z6L4_CYAAP|nr:flotillin family protein [Cyanobacterium aponinum]WRL43244.1 flotillin family protein [Cyanobacterium aponinum UTEX 3222]AFZ54774.1 band 7 protein [Cyanobacterium aponinum PCC 10605]MBD2392642.1 flotillin family protein [Cyanobacterium aponinum FACHB-4101]PHV64039.1 flotillin family protein [Cyanobacterium aponinum IPPAS B-1201]WPF87849.1 flotillin family protein [Cyanobacterium aponinum AL20115]
MRYWLELIQQIPVKNIDFDLENNRKLESNLTNNIVEIPSANYPTTMAQLTVGNITFFGGIIGVLVILGLVAIWGYTRVYVVTPNNEAFVRNGGIFAKEKKVILNGGCIVIPGIHQLTRVPLREISIDVVRQGNLAVRTRDYLRANMRVTFYVCVSADKDAVLTAAQRLSKQGKISPEDIKDALEKRADDAIRAAAKKKSIAEIDSDKLGFAEEVLNLIQQDLRKVGLTLNNIAISEIEESDTYDENNFFDAQGVRLRTETIQKSIKQKLDVELETQREKRELELNTQVAIEQQELQAEKQSLNIKKEKEEAKLTQMKEIEFLKAQREREVQESKDQEQAKVERNKILQQQAIEEEDIRKKLAVQQKQYEANIALEESNKQLRVAQTSQAQEAEVAEIERQQTVEASRLRAQIAIAEAEQDSKIAQQQASIAIANKEKERFAAEAQKAQAEEGVKTAREVENAERQKKLSLIVAEREAEEKRITDQNVVEIDVFRRRRQAEIARQAAELEAESIRTLADAQKYKAIAEAEGRLAIIQAENALSDANRTADLLKQMMPLLMPQLPEIVKSLAPQPGVLGDARIYAFPGISGNSANGNGNGNDINKLLLSTSGLSLINTLLDEGKLGNLVAQLKGLLHSDSSSNNSNNPSEVKISKNIDSTSTIESQSLTSDYNEETEDSYSGENLVDEDGDLDFSPWAENN